MASSCGMRGGAPDAALTDWGCRAAGGYQNGMPMKMILLFLYDPDLQSQVCTTLPLNDNLRNQVLDSEVIVFNQ